MKKLTLALSLLALVAAGGWAVASEDTPASTAAIGSAAPAFSLQDSEGNTHSLEQYRGRIVVLEWTNPECPFVVRHYNERTMQTMAAAMGEQDVVWLSINSSHFINADKANEERAQFGTTYPTLLDASGTVGRAYGARTTPHMYVIDAEGVLRYMGAIDDDPRGNKEAGERVNYVQQAVDALRAGEAPPTTSTQAYGCTVKYEGVR